MFTHQQTEVLFPCQVCWHHACFSPGGWSSILVAMGDVERKATVDRFTKKYTICPWNLHKYSQTEIVRREISKHRINCVNRNKNASAVYVVKRLRCNMQFKDMKNKVNYCIQLNLSILIKACWRDHFTYIAGLQPRRFWKQCKVPLDFFPIHFSYICLGILSVQ